MYRELLLEVQGTAAVISFNRPARLNALTPRMLSELRHALAAAEADTKVVGIILTGVGRGFSAGMDTEALAAGVRGERVAGQNYNELEADPGDPAMGEAFGVKIGRAHV